MQIKRLACKPYSQQGQCLHRQLLLLKEPAGRICRHHLHITEGQQLGAQLLGLDCCNAACQWCSSNSYHASGCMVFKWKFRRPAVASKSCMCCLPAPLSMCRRTCQAQKYMRAGLFLCMCAAHVNSVCWRAGCHQGHGAVHPFTLGAFLSAVLCLCTCGDRPATARCNDCQAGSMRRRRKAATLLWAAPLVQHQSLRLRRSSRWVS